jgi:hypothetical protein
MLYDNVVSNDVCAFVIILICILINYIYINCIKKNKYSDVRAFLRSTNRVVHIVHTNPPVQPRTRIRLACIQLVNDKEVPVYIHEHNLFPKK